MQSWQRLVTHLELASEIDNGALLLARAWSGPSRPTATASYAHAVSRIVVLRRRHRCSAYISNPQQKRPTVHWDPHQAQVYLGITNVPINIDAAASDGEPSAHMCAAVLPLSTTHGGLVASHENSTLLSPIVLVKDDAYDCGRASLPCSSTEGGSALSSRVDGCERVREDDRSYGKHHSPQQRLDIKGNGSSGSSSGGVSSRGQADVGSQTRPSRPEQHHPTVAARGQQDSPPYGAHQQSHHPDQRQQQTLGMVTSQPPHTARTRHQQAPQYYDRQHQHSKQHQHQEWRHQQHQWQQLHTSLVHARHCLSRALASAPSPAHLEVLLAASLASSPRLPLLDPVCISAAVCRMVRLRRNHVASPAAATRGPISITSPAARGGSGPRRYSAPSSGGRGHSPESAHSSGSRGATAIHARERASATASTAASVPAVRAAGQGDQQHGLGVSKNWCHNSSSSTMRTDHSGVSTAGSRPVASAAHHRPADGGSGVVGAGAVQHILGVGAPAALVEAAHHSSSCGRVATVGLQAVEVPEASRHPQEVGEWEAADVANSVRPPAAAPDLGAGSSGASHSRRGSSGGFMPNRAHRVILPAKAPENMLMRPLGSGSCSDTGHGISKGGGRLPHAFTTSTVTAHSVPSDALKLHDGSETDGYTASSCGLAPSKNVSIEGPATGLAVAGISIPSRAAEVGVSVLNACASSAAVLATHISGSATAMTQSASRRTSRMDKRFLHLVGAAMRQCLLDSAVTAGTSVGLSRSVAVGILAESEDTARLMPPGGKGTLVDWDAWAAQMRAQTSGGGVWSGSAPTALAFVEATVAAEAAVVAVEAEVAAATATAAKVMVSSAAPVGHFRPREIANVVWGLACLRWSDARLCGCLEDQQLLLRLAEELLPPVPPSAVVLSSPGGDGHGHDVDSMSSDGSRKPGHGQAVTAGHCEGRSGCSSRHTSVRSNRSSMCGSWFSNRWRPGEMAMLAWGMAHAGVAPLSRRWILSYMAAWDEQALVEAGPSDLACLVWALARWQLMASRAAAWRGSVCIGGGGAVLRARHGASLAVMKRTGVRFSSSTSKARGVRMMHKRLLTPPPRPVLPQAWLEAFWAASGAHLLHRSRSSRYSTFHFPTAGDGPSRAPLGASAAGHDVKEGAQPTFKDAGHPPATSMGPSELAMLLWSVGELQLTPPESWLEQALRAASEMALVASPLALATSLHGAARIGTRMASAYPLDARAGATAGGTDVQSVSSLLEKISSAAVEELSDGVTRVEVGNERRYPWTPQPQPQPDGLRLRPQRPQPVVCQSVLAAFARSYLGRCAVALGHFGPSQVVDLLAAMEMLSSYGHMPPPEALPVPLATLLDAAAARLQRCYSQGLGARHLISAVGRLAALRHTPPADWLDWWLDEMYGSFSGGRLRCHELTAVLRALAAFRIVPGAAWRAALLSAAARQIRHTDRPGLTHLAEAMAVAGLRIGDSSTSGGSSGRVSQLATASATAAAATVTAAAEVVDAALWSWLTRFLHVWSGLKGAKRVCYYGWTSPLLRPPTARHAEGLCAAVAALAGPVATWPPEPRAALRVALLRVPELRRRRGRSHERGRGCGLGKPVAAHAPARMPRPQSAVEDLPPSDAIVAKATPVLPTDDSTSNTVESRGMIGAATLSPVPATQGIGVKCSPIDDSTASEPRNGGHMDSSSSSGVVGSGPGGNSYGGIARRQAHMSAGPQHRGISDTRGLPDDAPSRARKGYQGGVLRDLTALQAVACELRLH